MGKNGSSLLVAGAVIAGVILLSRKKATGTAPGGVLLGGTLGNVDVGQNAVMGAHRLQKAPGAVVTASVNYTPGTTRNGTLTPWRYRFRTQVMLGNLLISQAPDFIDGPTASAQSGLTVANFNAPTATNVDQDYDVRVTMAAENADAQGNPTGTFTDLPAGTITHVAAFFVPGVVNLQLGGVLGVVNVAQDAGMAGWADPTIHGAALVWNKAAPGPLLRQG